jgi:hypothetical protein
MTGAPGYGSYAKQIRQQQQPGHHSIHLVPVLACVAQHYGVHNVLLSGYIIDFRSLLSR